MSIAVNYSFLRIPIRESISYLIHAKEATLEFLNSMNMFCEAQPKIASILHRTVCPEYILEEVTGSSLEKSLIEMRHYLTLTAIQHESLGRSLNDKVCTELKDKLASMWETITCAQTEETKLYEDLKVKQKNLENVSKNLEKAEVILEQAKSKLSKMKTAKVALDALGLDVSVSKAEKNLNLYTDNVNKCKLDLLMAYGMIDNMNFNTSQILQSLEESRIDCIKKYLQNFVNTERQLLSVKMEALQQLESTVENISMETDIRLLVEKIGKPESVHRYFQVLNFLEWHSQNVLQEDKYFSDSIDSIQLSESTRKLSEIRNIFPPCPENPLNTLDMKKWQEELQRMDQIIEEMLQSKRGRQQFIDELNGKRCSSGELHAEVFEILQKKLNSCLEKSITKKEIKNILQILNICNTFYRSQSIDHNLSRSEVFLQINYDVPTVDGSLFIQAEPHKQYLLQEINHHDIWSDKNFWQDLLQVAISEEYALCSQDIPWYKLNFDELNEVTARIHNIIFGQLASIALNMYQLGISKQTTREFISVMCHHYGIGDEQHIYILRSVQHF